MYDSVAFVLSFCYGSDQFTVAQTVFIEFQGDISVEQKRFQALPVEDVSPFLLQSRDHFLFFDPIEVYVLAEKAYGVSAQISLTKHIHNA